MKEYLEYTIRDKDCLIRIDRIFIQSPVPGADNDLDYYGYREVDYTICDLDKNLIRS